ncbi:hypothetical protein AB0O42_29055 [Streptomyces sp. NPDC089922]
MLTEVIATRYVTPLREGGSLPGIVEADDLAAVRDSPLKQVCEVAVKT